MPFKRVWDASCPRVYDRWEDNGKTWIIQDLEPKDDEEALDILINEMAGDEALCNATASVGIPVSEDPVSMGNMRDYWRICLSQRMSLGCYVEDSGSKKLVALNCCVVMCVDDKDDFKIEGAGWINVYKALDLVQGMVNAFEYSGLDKLLYAMGLVVKREYRGHRLGARILNARSPLALQQGIKATSTVFTGVASQKSAARSGFTPLAEISMKELADAGLSYPRNDSVIKFMIKRFDQ